MISVSDRCVPKQIPRRVVLSTIRLIVIVIAVCGLCLSQWVAQGSGQTNVSSAKADGKQLASLIDRANSIRDLTAEVLFAPGASANNLTCRFSCSKNLGLARIEYDLPTHQTITHFVDKLGGHAYVRAGQDLFALDPAGTTKWLSVYDQFSAVMNTTVPKAREVYFTGTEIANAKMCALFVFDQWGISTKLWIGLDDGVVYRKQVGDMTLDFSNVTVNKGLDKEFLGGNIQYGGTPEVSETELGTRLRNNVHQAP